MDFGKCPQNTSKGRINITTFLSLNWGNSIHGISFFFDQLSVLLCLLSIERYRQKAHVEEKKEKHIIFNFILSFGMKQKTIILELF